MTENEEKKRKIQIQTPIKNALETEMLEKPLLSDTKRLRIASGKSRQKSIKLETHHTTQPENDER